MGFINMVNNFLSGSKVYTIGPIEHGNIKNAKNWREKLKKELAPLNIQVLSPFDHVFKNFPAESPDLLKQVDKARKKGEYKWIHETAKQVRNKDLAMIDISTFVVACLDKNVRTWGSIDELIRSAGQNKPVFLCIKGGYKNLPFWLAAYFKPEWVYNSLDDAISQIKKINDGLITVNNKYWRVLDV